MKYFCKTVLLTACTLSLFACARPPVLYSFANSLSLEIASIKNTPVVAVGVQDKRPYILTKEKSLRFVGLQRGPLGDPRDVLSGSGHPFTGEINLILLLAIKKAGAHSRMAPIFPSATQEDIPTALLLAKIIDKDEQKPDYFLWITINEWKSDTHVNITLNYDLTATVYKLEKDNKLGKKLAENHITGLEKFAGHVFANPIVFARQAIPETLKKKLEELINAPAIIDALSGEQQTDKQ